MDSLRGEIVEAQKIRTDLIKWKLVLIATLGATGLGFTNSSALPHAELVLCCIPFVTAYTDILCRHLSLRIIVIGSFLRSLSYHGKEDNLLAQYELFSLRARKLEVLGSKRTVNAFAFEQALIPFSTVLISTFLLAYGFAMTSTVLNPIFMAGLVGILFTLAIECGYATRRRAISQLGDG